MLMLTGSPLLHSQHTFERFHGLLMANYTYQKDFNKLTYVTKKIKGKALELLGSIFVEKQSRPYACKISLPDLPWQDESE